MEMTRQVTALLPMKGHSERVPNKNLKSFSGFPLYHAIIQTLIEADTVGNIIIDTDSESIARDAKSAFGTSVEIIERPESLRGDFISMNKIIEHDIKQLDEDIFIQTHSTNPLLRPQTIDVAVQLYFSVQENGYDSVFSANKIQTRLYDQHSNPINHNPADLRRTQDLEPIFEENSNFYIFSKKSFFDANKNRIGLVPKIYEMNKLESVDIDEPEDFLLAEFLYQHIHQKHL